MHSKTDLPSFEGPGGKAEKVGGRGEAAEGEWRLGSAPQPACCGVGAKQRARMFPAQSSAQSGREATDR